MNIQQRLKKRYLHWQLLCSKILGHQANNDFKEQLSHQLYVPFTHAFWLNIIAFYRISTVTMSENIIYYQLKTQLNKVVASLSRPRTINDVLW